MRARIIDRLAAAGATLPDGAWLTDDAVERAFAAWLAEGAPERAALRVENAGGERHARIWISREEDDDGD